MEKPAGFWVRTLAVVVDLLLLSAITIPAALLGTGHRDLSVVFDLVTCLAYQGYVIVGHGRWGRTVGKALLGLKVETMEGARPTMVQSALRSSIDAGFALLTTGLLVLGKLAYSAEEYSQLGLLETGRAVSTAVPLLHVVNFLAGLWCIVTCIVVAAHPLKRALHDLIAGTMVVYQKQEQKQEQDQVQLQLQHQGSGLGPKLPSDS